MKAYKSAETDITGIAVAYYLMIGIFPLLLILANILPYLQLDASDLLLVLEKAVPGPLYSTVSKIVLDMIQHPSNSLLSFSVLSALWTISQTMTILQKAFDKAYGVEEGRNYIWGRILGMLMGLVLQLLLVIISFLSFFGSSLLNFLEKHLDINPLVYQQVLDQGQLVFYLTSLLTLFLLYYILPNVKIKKIRYVLPGISFVFLVFHFLGHFLDRYLLAYFNKLSNFRVAGSLVVLGIMLWFIVIAKTLLLGTVLNATYQGLKEGEFETKTPPLRKVLDRRKE